MHVGVDEHKCALGVRVSPSLGVFSQVPTRLRGALGCSPFDPSFLSASRHLKPFIDYIIQASPGVLPPTSSDLGGLVPGGKHGLVGEEKPHGSEQEESSGMSGPVPTLQLALRCRWRGGGGWQVARPSDATVRLDGSGLQGPPFLEEEVQRQAHLGVRCCAIRLAT